MARTAYRMPRWAHLCGLSSGAALLIVGGCGTATTDGFCKRTKNAGYTASSHDSWGEPWELRLTPDYYTGSCAAADATGYFRVMAVVLDSQKVPKAGVAVSAYLNSASGDSFTLIQPNTNKQFPTDTNTDSCGAAYFFVSWKCPSRAGEKHGGSLVVGSGSLSKSMEVSIEYFLPTTTP